jgi:hypothetical protein
MLTIAAHTRRVKIDLGVLEFDGDHRIRGYVEKPEANYHVSMGIGCGSSTFDATPRFFSEIAAPMRVRDARISRDIDDPRQYVGLRRGMRPPSQPSTSSCVL